MFALKAIIAGLVALFGSLAVGAADHGLSLAEAFIAAGAGLGGFSGVYYASNKAPRPNGDRGAVAPGWLFVLVALLTVLAILWLLDIRFHVN